ncbi:hypothetical protein V8C35DRAFT_181369 [Trichoderma chlorosporum]
MWETVTHKKQPKPTPAPVTVDSLTESLEVLKQRLLIFERNIQESKEQNERYGKDLIRLRKELCSVCEEIMMLRQEQIDWGVEPWDSEDEEKEKTSEKSRSDDEAYKKSQLLKRYEAQNAVADTEEPSRTTNGRVVGSPATKQILEKLTSCRMETLKNHVFLAAVHHFNPRAPAGFPSFLRSMSVWEVMKSKRTSSVCLTSIR